MNNSNTTLINYANSEFTQSQRLNSKTGLKRGGVSKVISYSLDDIDTEFYAQNHKILNSKKGDGYWLWKPYFIKKTLESINWGDYVFYCDSGSYFIKSLKLFTEINQDIIPFELPYIEKAYTKRDVFIILDCDDKKYTNTKQRLAGYSLWKKTPFSMKFIDEWLLFSKDDRCISDINNVMGKPNYKEFKDHRHDQSIFSVLTKKYNLLAYRDPSQWGNKDIKTYKSTSFYPQIIVSTRQRNISLSRKIKNILLRIKNTLKTKC